VGGVVGAFGGRGGAGGGGTHIFLGGGGPARGARAKRGGVPADRAGDEFASRCRELGVEDALSEVAGISPPMLVALGENGIKTVEDLAWNNASGEAALLPHGLLVSPAAYVSLR